MNIQGMPSVIPLTSPPRPIRVLVVDDSAPVVESIRRFLAIRREVTVVATALSGSGAIKACAQHRPDLVVMDVHMPEMDGLKTAATLRRKFPEVHIILISVDQSEDLRIDCLHHGADSFLPKIGLPRSLLAEIRRLFPQVPGSTPPFASKAQD